MQRRDMTQPSKPQHRKAEKLLPRLEELVAGKWKVCTWKTAGCARLAPAIAEFE